VRWPVAKIAQIAVTGTGGTPLRKEGTRFFGGTIPWIKSGELKDSVISSAVETITDAALAESNAKLVPPGAVLIALYGATAGRTALLGFETATNQAVCHIVPNPRLAEPKFIWYRLRAELPELLRKRVGGAQPNISQHIIRSTTLPLPALREQRRIVELLEQVDGLRRRREEVDALADRILPALFHKMFGDPVTNPKLWARLPLGEITRIDAPMVDPREPEHIDLPHVGPDRIEAHTGRLLPALTARQEGLISGKYLFDTRHVLYSKIRPYLRKVALPENRGLCSADMYPVTPLPDRATREYIWALLLSTAFTNYTTEHSERANIPKVNREQFANYLCPLPPLVLQQAFSERVGQLRSVGKRRNETRRNVDALFATMLHRAFTGELTAKWREAHLKELQAEMEHQVRLLARPPEE
jgi:type I restriction enzyme S subunit